MYASNLSGRYGARPGAAASDRGNYLKSGWVVRPQARHGSIKISFSWRHATPPVVTIAGGSGSTTPTRNAPGKRHDAAPG
jgi:hypothetical protein